MNIAANNVVAKLFVGFVAVAMLLMVAAPAKAQTAEELQQMINTLMAQVAALQAQVGQGGTSASGVCPYTWTRSLNMGASGADVMKLQQFLNADADTRVAASGVGSVGMETEYYGPLTGAAVAKFQTKWRSDVLSPLGLVNATTYFGPSTMAKANAVCVAAPVVTPGDTTGDDTTDDDTTTGALEGGEGSITVDTLLDSDVAIDLGDTDDVLAVEVTADDSDVSLSRIDFMFDLRPWLYFDEVNLLVGGEQVASLSGSEDFSEVSGEYRARFSGLDAIIREDDIAEITLELVVLGSMSGTRDADSVTVSLATDGIRFTDASGITDTSGIAINAVVTFSDTFGDGDIEVTLGEDSPTGSTFVLNETSRTTVSSVLDFDVEAMDSDIEITDVAVTFDSSSATDTVATTLYRAKLYSGSTLLKTKSVTGDTVTFDDLSQMIDMDDIAPFRVEVEFNRGDGLDVPATFTVVDVVVTGETTDFAAATDTLTVDEDSTILVDGLVADFTSLSSASANDGKNVTFTAKFDVTAYGATQYLSATSATAIAYTIVGPTGATTTDDISMSVSIAKDGPSNTYRISKGTTKTVTVSIVTTSNLAGFVTATLDTLTYGQSEGTPTGSTVSLGAPDYESAPASIVATP